MVTERSARMVAAESGRTTFIGNPCRICSCKKRYTRSGACTACAKRRNAEYTKKLVEIIRAAKERGS